MYFLITNINEIAENYSYLAYYYLCLTFILFFTSIIFILLNIKA